MQNTTLTDIDIPFGRLVAIILKVMLASIPAILVLYAIMAIISCIVIVILGVLGGLGGNLFEQLQQNGPDLLGLLGL